MARKDRENQAPASTSDTAQNDAAQNSSGQGKATKPQAQKKKTESSDSKHTPGFAEGNTVLSGYNLSVSGRMERVLSPFKTEHFFHFVSDSWNQFLRLKPHITERFSLPEFRHMSALMLFNRIEAVKFDALGVKQPANTRIPLPRDTRVFQPIWSVLANVGIVEDTDLRVTYIPDGIVPKSEHLDDVDDIENLLSCTLYDWESSWNEVQAARNARADYKRRTGIEETADTNEAPMAVSREELMERISQMRATLRIAKEREASDEYQLVNGYLRKVKAPTPNPSSRPASPEQTKGKGKTTSEDDTPGFEPQKYWTSASASDKLEQLMSDAKKLKSQIIQPKFDTAQKIESYKISDGTISTDPGHLGKWMRWDPQLFIDYENMVLELQPMALFSLSMPNESKGTYAWILPVEKRQDDDSSVSARMPRASIPTVTWVLSLLLQSSTLPYYRRSTWYTETDRCQNLLGLRVRYIRAAIKDPSAVEQYGTI